MSGFRYIYLLALLNIIFILLVVLFKGLCRLWSIFSNKLRHLPLREQRSGGTIYFGHSGIDDVYGSWRGTEQKFCMVGEKFHLYPVDNSSTLPSSRIKLIDRYSGLEVADLIVPIIESVQQVEITVRAQIQTHEAVGELRLC